MSTEENKALVRRWNEAFNKQNLAAMEELYADAGAIQRHTALWTAFPDLHYTVEDLIADGDKVVVRGTLRGTHQGDFMGIPPTGKQVSLTGITIDRIKDGKFVEGWANADMLGLLQQLGVIPPMAQGGA
jgi:predicted ester cyclase